MEQHQNTGKRWNSKVEQTGRSLVILTLSFRDFTVQRSALKNDYVCNSKGIEAVNFGREQDRGIWGLCREEKKRKCYIIISNI